MERYFNIGENVVFTKSGEDANGLSYEIGFLGQVAKYDEENNLYDVKTEDAYYENISSEYLDYFSSAYEIAVNKKLDIAEKNKEIKDSEERIVYAKKFKRAFKTISMSNLSDLEKNEALAIEMVKKDKIFPKIDAEAEKDAGVESGAAYYKTKIRAIFPNKPEKDSAEYRRVYVYFANYIQANIIERAKTLDKVVELLKDMYKKTLRLYIISVDSTGELEKKIEDEILKIKIDLKKASDLLAEKSIDYLKFEQDLVEKYGEDILNKHKSPISEYRIRWDKIEDSDILKEIHTEIVNQLTPIYLNVSELEEAIPQTELEFAEKLYKQYYNYRDDYDVPKSSVIYAKDTLPSILLTNVFGHKFSDLLRYPKSYKNIYYDAKSYNPLTSDELLYGENLIKQEKESIILGKTMKLELESANDFDSLKAFFDKYKEEKTYGYLPRNTAFYYKSTGSLIYYITMYDGSSYILKRNQNILTPKTLDDYLFLKKKSIAVIEEELKKREALLDEYKQKYNGASEERWTWANIKKTSPSSPKVGITINSQTPLSHIERINGISINGDILKTDEGIKYFYSNILGINRITYGKSLPDDERQAHAYHFAISLIDFCDVLNWDLKSFTSQLNLGVGFAISGSGKASATYSGTPANYINLTRRRGDGSLAHELVHYIDNFAESDKKGMATDFQHSARYWYNPKVSNHSLGYLILDFFRFVIKGTIPYDESIPQELRKEFVSSKVYQENRTTGFYFNSKKLSSYWTKKWELFARASECYIYDKLAEKGMANNYLVSGEYFDSPYGVYPAGVERKIINIFLDKIFKGVKNIFIQSDFVAPYGERGNYYKLLTGDTNEEAEGEEVSVESDEDKIFYLHNKIEELILILQKG